jgi:hypothetical protein
MTKVTTPLTARARDPVLHRNRHQPCRRWHHRARNAVLADQPAVLGKLSIVGVVGAILMIPQSCRSGVWR